MFKTFKAATVLAAATLGSVVATSAQAQIFQDNSITYSYGTRFHEPFNTRNIEKNWVSFQHVSGDKLGGNFFLLDMKASDSADPTSGSANTANPQGAQELYGIYIRTFSWNKVTGSKGGFGPIADFGWTVGGHANAKNDSFGSRKKLFTSGLYIDWAMPMKASLRTSAEICREWNRAPSTATRDADYQATGCFNGFLMVPFTVGSMPVYFTTGISVVAPKGEQTTWEYYVFPELMADVGTVFGARKGLLEVGVRYDYWLNKFGNNTAGPASDGAFDRVPMLRVRSHF